jgi:hypothetical protein
MVDKRACQSLRVDQGHSTELCSTNVAKNSQPTKIVLDNLAERIVVPIRVEISDHEHRRPHGWRRDANR